MTRSLEKKIAVSVMISGLELGVEVFSDALAGLPARERARRAGDAARAVLRRARRG